MHPHYLPDHRLCVLPLPLVGEGRGEGDSFPPPLGEGEGGANLAFAASPAHIQGRARPPSLPSPRGGRREGQRGKDSSLPPLFPPPLGEGEGGGHQKRKKLPSP